MTGPITVPSTITTVDGGGFTISATDIGSNQFNGGILTNASPGQTMNIENLTVSGPATGFQVCTNSGNLLYGIYFNDASGSVNTVKVQHIWQQPNASNAPSCGTGTAIRAENPSAPRTVTITNTTVVDYQKNGIDGRGGMMTMNVSGSTMGPPNNQEGLIAPNGLVYFDSTGTAMNNTILGSGDQACPFPPCVPGTGGTTNATAVLLFGAKNVTITHNTITGDKTDIGVSVSAGAGPSTGSIISFNNITRTLPDVPDPTGHGIDVYTPDGSSATPICNTFSMWNTNIVGAEQIACTPLPNGSECKAYSAPAPAVDSGKNYVQTSPWPIIDATPFTWTVASGTLPPGLSLSSAGAITGTPTAAGTFNFTLKLVDATGLTATQAETITVDPDCVVDANIQITPSATNPVGATHTFTAHVNVNNAGTVGNAPNGTPISFTIDSGPGAFTSPNPCTTAGGTGSCTITLVSNVTGATVVSAHVTVSVRGLSLTRQTDGTSGNSGPATKLWAAAAAQTSVIAASGPVTTVTAGTAVHDQVSVAKAPGTPAAAPAPAGNVVFHRYTTLDCTGTSTDQTVALTPGNPSAAVSDNFAAIANLSYRADYLGNANYPAATGACEPLTVTPVQAPALAIVKNPATQSVPVGGKAKFKITVTNAGNTTLANVTVRDPAARNCNRTSAELPALASMAPGTSVTYSCSRGNISKSFTNVATATAAPPSGPSATASDSARVKVSPLKPSKKKPALKLVNHKKPKATG